MKKRSKFTIGTREAKKVVENLTWERLGLHLGGFEGGLGRDLELWACLWSLLGVQVGAKTHPNGLQTPPKSIKTLPRRVQDAIWRP